MRLLYSVSVIVLLFISPAQILFSLEKKSSLKSELIPDKKIESSINLTIKNFETFKFSVPNDVFVFELVVRNAPADLDLFVKRGARIESYDNVDYSSESESNNETLRVTRLSDPSLSSGVYYVDVAYQGSSLPVLKNRKIKTIPFTIELRERKINADSLVPGNPKKGYLVPENGMASLFKFTLPTGIRTFRIDISNTSGDIDLMSGYEKKMLTRDNCDFISDSMLGKESLIVKNDDGSPLRGGEYYVVAFDQVSGDTFGNQKADQMVQTGTEDFLGDSYWKESFSISLSFSSVPPESLLQMPEVPTPADEFQNILLSTVEIIGKGGKGSGCLVSHDGYIITNWHVVKNSSGAVSKPVYVAMNLKKGTPPEELFRARLVDFREKEDLALLKIDSGFYGQPLSTENMFPSFTISKFNTPKLGEPISILGYPSIGGTGSRASISLTTGIVSGFDNTQGMSFIKTDAEINGGNSGGAAVDVYYNLIGLPTVIIGENSGQIGYITPVSEIPSRWLDYFN